MCVRRGACSVLVAMMSLPAMADSPLVLEQTTKIVLPDPAYTFTGAVAIDGNSIIAGGAKPLPSDGPQRTTQAAFLFERSGSGWVFVSKLVEGEHDEDFEIRFTVGMQDGIASIVTGRFGAVGVPGEAGLRVFERTASGWTRAPARGFPDTTDIEVDSGTILASTGTCSNDGEAFRKNASGEWVSVGSVFGYFRGCDDEFRGKDVDISGNTMILAINDSIEGPGSPFLGEAHIFEGPPGAWLRTILTSPEDPPSGFGGFVSIENGTAFATSANSGTFVYRRDGLGAWSRETVIRPANLLMTGSALSVETDSGFVLQGFGGDDYRATNGGAVGVFQRDASGVFRYVAKLVATDSEVGGLRRNVDMSGRTVVAAGQNVAYVFELPADLSQPQLQQDDFQDGNDADWTRLAGSSFSVVTTPATRLYRQNSLAGNAGSLLANSDRRNQSIQADVRPLEFGAGTDRWFGLAVRYSDAGNYYYVTARSTNVIQLRKIVNGVFGPIASAPHAVPLNRRYRLRLEAVGTLLRVYVDGNLVLQARDNAHSEGKAGVLMFRTRADYDNVVVSSNPSMTLFRDDFQDGASPHWKPGAGSAFSVVSDGGSNVYAQASLAGDARSVTGVSTDDQILQVRAKATAFAPGGERWFGLMARYQDDRNYYYLTVRNTNVISLRKVVNGVVTVLDSAALTVTPGTWYRLRLEAIGGSLRAFVHNQLLVEANDSSFEEGQYGVVTFKAAARYDDVLALQP
jgi:hypothetical protein